jgi:CRISPR/Cas system-associated endonuclease Cas1
VTANRLDIDGDTIERDLVKLVLTVVELLRQLMERQALRRVDQGDLTEDQEERIGRTLLLLDDRMALLRERFHLSDQDLNLDLGPLGPLLPR